MRFNIIFVKLLNIRAELRDNPVITQIFIFHATEQVNCKSALNIKKSNLEIHFSKT